MPGSIGPSADAERFAQEQEVALTSRLFATMNSPAGGGAAVPALAAVAAAAQAAPQTPATDIVSQDHRLAFVNGAVDRRTTIPDRIQPAVSVYALQAGSVIRRDDRAQPWVWRGGAGGVANVECICGRPMRPLHASNKASLWQCDNCRSTVRVKRQSEGARREASVVRRGAKPAPFEPVSIRHVQAGAAVIVY
jgi:hypothetical protein